MALTPIAPGVSLDLWDPDEEILADNLNQRERTYGGFYQEDFMGMSDGVPIFTFSSGGNLYGQGGIYSFLTYQAVAGAGLVEEILDIEDDIPTFADGSPTAPYGGTLYGFLSYGSTPIVESMTISEVSVTVLDAAAGTSYGSGTDYAFAQYGGTPDATTPMSIDDSAGLTLTTASVASNVYGGGGQYGFSMYVGP